MMEEYEISKALENEVILVDTREQNTQEFARRVKLFACPVERQKLNFGDYSIKTTLKDGTEFSLADRVCIERKMSLDEIAQNMTRERDRFAREFNRAKKAGAKVYIVVENALGWSDIACHNYKSQYNPKAFTASLAVWQARYGCHLLFIDKKIAPRVIANILHYELREALKHVGQDDKRMGED